MIICFVLYFFLFLYFILFRLSDLCHYYLDEIGEISLYKQWQHWYDDDEKNDDLYSIMCR